MDGSAPQILLEPICSLSVLQIIIPFGFSSWSSQGQHPLLCQGVFWKECTLQVIYLFAMTTIGWTYAVECHWAWGGGWLQTDYKYIDFAGSGVIHYVGGLAGLIATVWLGPRKGRFDP